MKFISITSFVKPTHPNIIKSTRHQNEKQKKKTVNEIFYILFLDCLQSPEMILLTATLTSDDTFQAPNKQYMWLGALGPHSVGLE